MDETLAPKPLDRDDVRPFCEVTFQDHAPVYVAPTVLSIFAVLDSTLLVAL